MIEFLVGLVGMILVLTGLEVAGLDITLMSSILLSVGLGLVAAAAAEHKP